MVMRVERARLAADIFASRRDRDAVFVGLGGGFGEPAWDMLLVLFIADAEGRAVAVSDLIRDTHVEREIAQPYVGWLVSQGLAKFGDTDLTVRLVDAGRRMMDAYLDRRSMRSHDNKFMH